MNTASILPVISRYFQPTTLTREALISKWRLSVTERAQCSSYYLLHWNRSYLALHASITSNYPHLVHKGTYYSVVFYNCTAECILADDSPTQVVKLSFRKPACPCNIGNAGILPTVLIAI